MRLNLEKLELARAAFMLCALMASAVPAVAQTTPAAPSITQSVLAEAKLYIDGQVPLFIGAVGVVIPTGQSSDLAAVADGILYQMSGSSEIVIGRATRPLNAREALFIAAGKKVVVKAGTDMPSTLMHFLVGRAAELDRSGAATPATVIKIFRSPGRIPNLKPGAYDLNLTTVTLPPYTPPNSPHHRAGAALYYVLFGTGTTTVQGEVIRRAVGSVIYEPPGLAQQWGNPGAEELRFVVFNISAEGASASGPEAPAKPR
ncbi:MAG TPA: cupin domain-containing protein [Stellaceae bacterium]|nr:cupin domain-containing protein [Stellaceae bacterium]